MDVQSDEVLHRFFREAEQAGIAYEQALDLYHRLYKTEESPLGGVAKTEESPLSGGASPYASQTGLSRLVQTLVWIGTVLVIGAHAWWSTQAYEGIGIGIVLALTLLWQAAFLFAAEWSWQRGEKLLVSGFSAIVAFYTPLTVYALERSFGVSFENDFEGFYPWISAGWIWMELAAIAVAVILMLRYQRPFLTVPLTLFVGFLLMDGAYRFLGGDDTGNKLEWIVLCGGILVIAAAVTLDYLGLRRFAFWPHLGAIWLINWGLWVILPEDQHQLALFIASVLAFALGIWLARITYLAYGAIFGWVAISMLSDSSTLPFLLMLGGIVFIGAAIMLAKVDSPLRRWLESRDLPARQRDLAY
jgi:hypothetical protein